MSPWALKGVFFLLLIATVPMSTFAAPKTKVEEAKTEIKRVNREIRDLDLDDFQSVLPVQVDLSSAMGVVVHHLKMLEKNVSSFQSRMENTIRDVLREKETTCSNEKNKDNTPSNKEEEGQSHTAQVTQSKSHSQSRTEATKPPDRDHEANKNGSPATASPPIIDPFSGMSWESILGGCAMNSSELDRWVLLQYRDVKNAGSTFWSMSDEEYENGYNLHPSRKYAYWIGLKAMRDKSAYYRNSYTRTLNDFVMAYHCEGLVRCTRYSNFRVLIHPKNQLWFDGEMHHEGMNGRLLDQYIDKSFSSRHPSSGPSDPREACNHDIGPYSNSDGHWWYHRCNSLCPTCKNVGGKFEDIGFDASKCTHTFMAMRAMIYDF